MRRSRLDVTGTSMLDVRTMANRLLLLQAHCQTFNSVGLLMIPKRKTTSNS